MTNSPDMPDMQYDASHNDTMVGLRDHVLSNRCKISQAVFRHFLTLL